jgi:hypothetical protein
LLTNAAAAAFNLARAADGSCLVTTALAAQRPPAWTCDAPMVCQAAMRVLSVAWLVVRMSEGPPVHRRLDSGFPTLTRVSALVFAVSA